MIPAIGKRLLQGVPIVLGVTIITFFLVKFMPGDPTIAILGPNATAANVAALQAKWGLDQPVWTQYIAFLDRFVHGDLGDSLYFNAPVNTLLFERLPDTLWLLGYSTVLSLAISIPLAGIAALSNGRLVDHLIRGGQTLALGFPAFWIGIMLLYGFALNLRIFPAGGVSEGFFGHLNSLFLPGLSIAIGLAPIQIRSLRAALLKVLESEYIVTARSKGLRESTVITRHALPNAIISTVPLIGVQIAWLIGATLVIEQLFAIPGIGALMITAILNRDFPVIQGVTLLFAILVVIVYLVTDITHASLDPRLKLR